jgi:hypothetical protein
MNIDTTEKIWSHDELEHYAVGSFIFNNFLG